MTQTALQATPSVVPRSAEVAAAELGFRSLSKLQWFDANSTAVASIAYDRKLNVLYVKMNGNAARVYGYEGVSERTFMELATASSVGSYYARNIKPNYPCVKAELAVSVVAS